MTCSGICYKNNVIVLITIFVTILNLCLLTRCGRVKRVVGAMDVECGNQPRVASLRNSSSLQHLCGASILSPHYALTAAHCVPNDEHQYSLQLNNYCVKDDDKTPIADVQEIIIHPLYEPITRAHDVAVLRVTLYLDDVTWLNDTLLPSSSFGVSGECTLYGYGYNVRDTKETSERLLAGTLRIVSLDKCTEALGPNVAPRYDHGMVCAIGDGVDACQCNGFLWIGFGSGLLILNIQKLEQPRWSSPEVCTTYYMGPKTYRRNGDSGSPLICSGGRIEGVSSYGMSCAVPGIPGVYTSIGAHLSWITAVIHDKK